jgi:hypothetical protein
MRKILTLILLAPSMAFAAAATWTNPSGTTAVAVCAQAGVTCDAPTLATQGLSLDNVQGYSVTACAASSQTLSGAGTLTAYVYDDAVGLWSRIPELDLTVGTATIRCITFLGVWAAAPRGRVAYVPTTVTASSNSVTVYMIAEKRR